MSEPKGRGAAWTEERGTSDEGRRRLKGAPEASGRQSTSDEGRRRPEAPRKRARDRAMSNLVIPARLKPKDGRFGSGPAKIRPEQLAALADSGATYLGTSHRQPPVRSLVRRIR